MQHQVKIELLLEQMCHLCHNFLEDTQSDEVESSSPYFSACLPLLTVEA